MLAVVRRFEEPRLPELVVQLVHVTRTCPMPRPRPAASRAGAQMHGVQLTCALPGHSW